MIFAAMVVIGIVLYLADVFYYRKKEDRIKGEAKPEDTSEPKEGGIANAEEETGECCGLHLVCEKNSLSPMSDEIIYYDDDELDRFQGRGPEDYSPDEAEEFREVLMTLRPEDIAGWARSLQLRKIEMPPEIKDELFILIRELRDAESE